MSKYFDKEVGERIRNKFANTEVGRKIKEIKSTVSDYVENIKQLPSKIVDKQRIKSLKKDALSINPIPLNSKELSRDLVGKRSIRINLQHRLVYEVIKEEKIIKILSMWGHYQ